MKPIVVLGSGGHARVVADVCRAAGRRVEGFLSPDAAPGDLVGGIRVLGGDELLDDPGFAAEHEFLVGIGEPAARRRLAALVRARRGELATVCHPNAVVAADTVLGAGTVLMAGSVVNPGATVGAFAIVNTGATVDHDGRLEDGVHVGPGAHLAGEVRCGEDAVVGPGAVVTRGRRIGPRAVVGAGAVVVADVAAGATVMGNPARVVE